MSSASNDPNSTHTFSLSSSSDDKQNPPGSCLELPQSSAAAAAAAAGLNSNNVATTATSLSLSNASCAYDQDASTRLTCDVLCSLSHQCVAGVATGAAAASSSRTTTLPGAPVRGDQDSGVSGTAVAPHPLPVASSSSFPTSSLVSSTTVAGSGASFFTPATATPVLDVAAVYCNSYCNSNTTQHQQHQHQHFGVDESYKSRRSSISSTTSNHIKPAATTAAQAAAAATAACPINAAAAAAAAANKQHQLPMFLSKTYHMIDRCDPEISTWSDNGESFVVKVRTLSSPPSGGVFSALVLISFCSASSSHAERGTVCECKYTSVRWRDTNICSNYKWCCIFCSRRRRR
jgi:hypothetical protein